GLGYGDGDGAASPSRITHHASRITYHALRSTHCALRNTESSARTVTAALDADETQALLHDVPAAYHTEVNDALLTALAQTLSGWTGARATVINLEGHGREGILEGVDISRTAGWFTAIFPVRLELPRRDDPGATLKAVKEQLRRVPQHGIGYGLLRYLCEAGEARELLAALPQPELSFNYLGQWQEGLQGGAFAAAAEARGPERHPEGWRTHLIEVDGSVAGGCLQLQWTYSKHLHRRATIEGLAQRYLEALRGLIAHCRTAEAGGHTPSDFPLAHLDQARLDKVLARTTKSLSEKS
ncbi:MAG TPA: condensation domain-containing protein, partial [Anaerolineae bacterium]|nr:condensation domain-containing protein [Anaerolineae bacterium]